MKEINETGKLQIYQPWYRRWQVILAADLLLVIVIIAMLIQRG